MLSLTVHACKYLSSNRKLPVLIYKSSNLKAHPRCFDMCTIIFSGDGAAVLIRSLEPVDNLELMDKLRTKGKAGASLLKKNGVGLCNGPSKLCQSLSINKNDVNKTDLCSSDDIWLEKGDLVSNDSIVKCKRININYAEDWVDKPLRFYILGSAFVSVRDKLVEKDMKAQ